MNHTLGAYQRWHVDERCFLRRALGFHLMVARLIRFNNRQEFSSASTSARLITHEGLRLHDARTCGRMVEYGTGVSCNYKTGRKCCTEATHRRNRGEEDGRLAGSEFPVNQTYSRISFHQAQS